MRNFSQFKEATVTSSLDRLTDAELKAKEQREKRKPSSATQTANKAEADQVSEREKFKLAQAKVENRKRSLGLRDQQRKMEIAGKEKTQAIKQAQDVRGGPSKLKQVSQKQDSISATADAAGNMLKNTGRLARNVAAIPLAIRARAKTAKLGRVMKPYTGEPTGGTKTQLVRDKLGKAIAQRGRAQSVKARRSIPVAQRTPSVNRAAQAIRQQTLQNKSQQDSKPVSKPVNKVRPSTPAAQGPSQQGAVKKIRRTKGQVMQDHYNYSEDYIREADKKGEKKNDVIDVMKGKNDVKVNPEVQAEAKKMTKNQIKKRDEIADAIGKKDMKKRYGDENVRYAIATKLAMKGKKKKVLKDDVTLQDANGNDFVQIVDLIKPEPLIKTRSVQEISECWKTHKQVGYKKKGGRMVPNCVPKNEETILELNKYEKMQAAKKRAAVKAVTGGRISKDSSQKIKDQIATERSNPDNKFVSSIRSAENKTNAHLRKIGKRQRENDSIDDNPLYDKPKNFTKSRHRGNRKNSKAKSRKSFKRGVGFKPSDDASRDANAQLELKPAPGLNKNSGDAMISRQFNTNKMGKPSTKNIKKGSIPEAKMPVQGFMKLAAMVAVNKKKRKNALQNQKYIGEQTKEVDKKKLNKSLEKSLELTNYGSAEPFLSKDELKKRTEAKRKKRERIAKGDDRTTAQYNKDNLETAYQKNRLNQIFKTEGTIVEKQGGDKKNPDSRINYRTNYTQDRELNSNPDLENFERQQKSKLEKQREEKRKRIEQNKQKKRRQRPSDVPSNPGSNKRAMRDAMRDIGDSDSDT